MGPKLRNVEFYIEVEFALFHFCLGRENRAGEEDKFGEKVKLSP